MGLFRRKVRIERAAFGQLATDLARALESLREEFLFGSLSQLKREGVDTSSFSPTLQPGSDVDCALKAFQLTCIMGVVWNYIDHPRDQLDFDALITRRLDADGVSRAAELRERYLDCQGDLDYLARSLASHVHAGLGSPEPSSEYLPQFAGGAKLLAGLSQLAVYVACGDSRMERKLKQQYHLP